MNVHQAVREAQHFLAELINSEQINGTGVYQEPQSHYYAHQNAKQVHQTQPEVYRDVDGDSLGSNGYNNRFDIKLLKSVLEKALFGLRNKLPKN